MVRLQRGTEGVVIGGRMPVSIPQWFDYNCSHSEWTTALLLIVSIPQWFDYPDQLLFIFF